MHQIQDPVTYKVLTTAQPSYLHHLITVQPHRSTHSSSVVTLSRPPSASSLRITDRSFRYASPHLWNQLPASLRQPCTGLYTSNSDLPMPVTSPLSINSPLSSSITILHSFTPASKPTSFPNPSNHRPTLPLPD